MVLSTSYVIISGIKNNKRLSHGNWLSPDLSTRADNGRGLIKRAINKMSCYNLFITHSNPLFTEFYLKETTDRGHVGRCLNTIFGMIIVGVIGSSATERTNVLDV